MSGKKPLSNEKRALIIDLFNQGKSNTEIVSVLNCSRFQVYRAIKVFNETGRIEKKTTGGLKKKKLSTEHTEFILNIIDEDCSVTLNQLKKMIKDQFDLNVSIPLISKVIGDFSYSFKRVGLVPERRNCPEVLDQRKKYVSTVCQIIAMGKKEIFYLDETGFNICMRSIYGRAPLNVTPKKIVKGIRAKNISMSCCISKSSVVYYEVNERPYNRESYGHYLSNLFEVLHSQNKKYCVFVLDNVPFHRSKLIQNLFQAHGHDTLYLPPYSPFLNPIEEAFSKIKSIVRRKEPKNNQELMKSTIDAHNEVTSGDCESFFSHTKEFFTQCLEGQDING